MNCSKKTTIKDFPEMNQGLPQQQVITEGEHPTEKEVRDATREMQPDESSAGRG